MKAGMTIGHFYGKTQDDKGKNLAGVTMQLFVTRFDTLTKQIKSIPLKTTLSESNGDFDFDNLPLLGRYSLKITSLGFKKQEMPLTFGFKPDMVPNMNVEQLAAMAEKDLGNIRLEKDQADLGTVTVVTTAKQTMELGVDRKVFNVDKNLSSTGQTAVEVLKNIPSLSVDIDGNVSLRNATPVIFIDGRPTTLSLDQIPSDIIEKVEVISNPSSKFDAGGGGAGILNIVLKKNRKNGYNGNLRAGMDSRVKFNGGGDLNYRKGKINLVFNANYNQRKSKAYSLTSTDFNPAKALKVESEAKPINEGVFQFYRGGIDFFVSNRSTISVATSLTKGNFSGYADQTVDSVQPLLPTYTNRHTDNDFHFQNAGAQLSFKHNFIKDGHNISFDANYNGIENGNGSYITATTKPSLGTARPSFLQQGNGTGSSKFYTLQTDYENPLSGSLKLEAGLRAAVRAYSTQSFQYLGIDTPGRSLYFNPSSSINYQFNDQVYAGYTTLGYKHDDLSVQIGLRAESSNYTGNLLSFRSNADSVPFKVDYPLSLFPSASITYKGNRKQDYQLNYSRKVNRPNFFQLLPSYDFSDPQNPSVGNPALTPEFTHNLEANYNYNYVRTSDFLATTYLKYTTNLLTRYVFKDINRNQHGGTTGDSIFYTSYINASKSYTTGLELTNKMGVTAWFDLMLNLNLYNTKLIATLPGQGVSSEQFTVFGKINATFKLGSGISFQFTSESRSKTLIPPGGNQVGGGRSGFMGGIDGGRLTLAQGYMQPRIYDIDVALKKDWTWKRGQGGSLTISCNDIFNARIKTKTNAGYFVQDTERYRDPQVVRANFSYRFGKMDVSLFKRKSNKAEQGPGESMGN